MRPIFVVFQQIRGARDRIVREIEQGRPGALRRRGLRWFGLARDFPPGDGGKALSAHSAKEELLVIVVPAMFAANCHVFQNKV